MSGGIPLLRIRFYGVGRDRCYFHKNRHMRLTSQSQYVACTRTCVSGHSASVNLNKQWLPPYQNNDILTPWSRVLLEKLTGFQLVNKFPTFYGTRRFITAFTDPATCPYPEPARSSPYSHIPLTDNPF